MAADFSRREPLSFRTDGDDMINITQIREHRKFLGADGVHVGGVAHMDGASQSS